MTLGPRGTEQALPYWRAVPVDWPAVSDADVEAFVDRVVSGLAAVSNSPLVDPNGATPSLAAVAHRWTVHGDLSPADVLLLAQAGLLVPLEASDRLLAAGSAQRIAILRALEHVDCGTSLVRAGPHDLTAMEKLHAAVDAALSGSGLDATTRDRMAMFLCSRLRPRLFPPSTLLADSRSHRERWQLYRAALDHPRVRAGITEARRTHPDLESIEGLALIELGLGELFAEPIQAPSGCEA